MEKEQRTRLQKATQDARRLLEEEFRSQLLQTYDIDVEKARWAEEPGAHLLAEQGLIREKLVAWIEHKEAQINDRKEALLLALREMAFTALNRFVALKLMEARELVRPCVSGGLESAGFLEFTAVAQGLLADQESSYRLYVETTFEDVSRELRALFDPRDPASLLWPKRTALLELLDILNRPELAELWKEDETLGWIYQYFNGDAERKKMREESSAPRNSRELAVRNQFFTPRYVVEFLTDNTLGRIWYEMRQGITELKDRCRYLVQRPNEIWLQPGEEPPAQPDAAESLSQEKLLCQPIYIHHRPLKDPREIRMLDPACGSMHFGLYAFDLYVEIYTEAWEIAQGFDELDKSAEAFAPFADYASGLVDKAAFLREVPRLILQYNIHGIDIDPRATQIARLTLWLRAQRAWKEQQLEVAHRPPITRSNVVCAEPMPGERELLANFVDQQFPEAERGLVQQLLEAIFDKMQLAGEAGSLLMIEEEIRDAIDQAQRAWQKLAIQQQNLFSASELAALGGVGSSLNTDLQNLTKDFWVNIEERIYAALHDFAKQSETGSGYQRRLFAEDAAQGFAFIDACRMKFDVAMMNPPFGAFSRSSKSYATEQFPNAANDIFAAFIDCFLSRLGPAGMLGAITSRTGFFIASFADWRREVLGKSAQLLCFSDLGIGVMDNATVEAAAYILSCSKKAGEETLPSPFIRLLSQEDKEPALVQAVHAVRGGCARNHNVFWANNKQFELLPDAPFVYWAQSTSLRSLAKWPSFEPTAAQVRKGLRTGDNFRFVRALWEIPQVEFTPAISAASSARERESSMWVPLVLSGSSQPWFSPLLVALNWRMNGKELRQYVTKYGSPSRLIQAEDYYFRPGMSWTRRAARFVPYAIPSGCIPTGSRPMAFPNDGLELNALAVSASRVASTFMRFYGDWFSRPNFLEGKVKLFPWPELPPQLSLEMDSMVRRETDRRRIGYRAHEPFFEFVKPFGLNSNEVNETISIDWATLLGHELESAIEKAHGLSISAASELHQDLDESLTIRAASQDSDTEEEDADDEGAELLLDCSGRNRLEALVSYAVGCAFGRWDIRYATGEKTAPEVPDPFAPLPVCPPGQLQNAQGLPARPEDVPPAYPVQIAWDGILVDDPNHPLDIDQCVRDVIDIILPGQGSASAQAIEQEACEILEVASLRDYFRRFTNFFADHLKRYSKSRRQAPIYWQILAGNGSYSAWLYYHRFSADTLYQVLGIVKLRLEEAERDIADLGAHVALSAEEAERIHEIQTMMQDLRLLKSELDLVAPLWNPNLNDGVVINHAILWRITPYTPWHKKCKECWDKLVKGEYDWAHLAFHLWPERVIPKCTTDRSLAVAHGLEERLWQETNNGNWLPRQLSEADLQALIAERSNPAVKSALDRFLTAPPPVAPTRTRASRSTRSTGSSAPRRPRGATAVVDAEATRQVLLALTAAPSDGLAKAAIADLIGVEANALTAVIKHLKESGQIDQLGTARGAKYCLTEHGRVRLDKEEEDRL